MTYLNLRQILFELKIILFWLNASARRPDVFSLLFSFYIICPSILQCRPDVWNHRLVLFFFRFLSISYLFLYYVIFSANSSSSRLNFTWKSTYHCSPTVIVIKIYFNSFSLRIAAPSANTVVSILCPRIPQYLQVRTR